jgi:ectoine hydroxylase-related dioxygenase (phytanoyl-CoA dioxygenase family)
MKLEKKRDVESDGFAIVEGVYSDTEVERLCNLVERSTLGVESSTFRKSKDLFAIRQFHKEIPEAIDAVFNKNLKNIIKENFGEGYFITKSIYFDKPEKSNWFVAYHQDLTISVNKKVEVPGYVNWTVKHDQYAVHPPEEILENNFTVRIHLDKTTSENGALKVIAKSHLKGIRRVETLDKNDETTCEVKKGGIMIMKPLLFHASNKTTNNARRRVIHIEFSRQELPEELQWSERLDLVAE